VTRAAVALLALFAAGCKTKSINPNGCQQDSDCGSPVTAFRCELETGECYCRTDDACPPAQFCNPAGFCQDRTGCATDADCNDPSLFCDTGTGSCLPLGRCTTDLQCPLGKICDFNHSQCVDGCRSNGDCPGDACRCADAPCNCTGQTPAELMACAAGVCDPFFCSDNTFCQFGQKCGIPPGGADAGITRNECYNDFDIDNRPYCARCANGGGIATCGFGANFCIIDTRTNSTYCGVDCSHGEQCPRGYGCRDIRVVYTRWECGPGIACPGDTSLSCATDMDCKRGATCLIQPGFSTGFCQGQCVQREGSQFGFCSCQVDEDCAQDQCDQASGYCTITKQRCVNETDCHTIHCVDFNGSGGCVIGQNCTPSNGLTCVEVGGQ
jgi:hypothetical protein